MSEFLANDLCMESEVEPSGIERIGRSLRLSEHREAVNAPIQVDAALTRDTLGRAVAEFYEGFRHVTAVV